MKQPTLHRVNQFTIWWWEIRRRVRYSNGYTLFFWAALVFIAYLYGGWTSALACVYAFILGHLNGEWALQRAAIEARTRMENQRWFNNPEVTSGDKGKDDA